MSLSNRGRPPVMRKPEVGAEPETAIPGRAPSEWLGQRRMAPVMRQREAAAAQMQHSLRVWRKAAETPEAEPEADKAAEPEGADAAGGEEQKGGEEQGGEEQGGEEQKGGEEAAAGDEKAAGEEQAAETGGEEAAAEQTEEEPAPISAKLEGVGRKIFRSDKPEPTVQKPAYPDVTAENDDQKKALDAARAGGGTQIMIGEKMNDSPRLDAHYSKDKPGEWQKWEYKMPLPPLPSGKKRTIVVHYFRNGSGGAAVELKFKNDGTGKERRG